MSLSSSEQLINTYKQLFKDNETVIDQNSADVLSSLRSKALQSFEEAGLPRKKSEKYKYLDLQKIFDSKYDTSFGIEESKLKVTDVFKCDIPNINTHVVLLTNGRHLQMNTGEIPLPEEITICLLSEATEKYPDIVEKHFNKYAVEKSEGLLSLNSMFAQNGIFIHVPKNVVLEKPIQIINISSGDTDLLINHRNLFVFDEMSQAKIVVCDHTMLMNRYLNNSVTEVFVGEGAHVEIDKIQNENNNSVQIAHVYMHQLANSKGVVNNISLHGGLIRNNVDVKLTGEGAENHTLGLYFTDRNQHIDNFTNIEHIAPNCFSNQLFKGVLDDQATGAFNGKIHVHRDAQKTLAYQTNNNILLTDTAKMNTKPQLEIYADDVKCSHGATVGQLDENALFYLRTRGINTIEAKFLLMYAFADEIIKHIGIEPLQFRIHELVDKRLRGELSRCHNCDLHIQ
jgi:Fe-S cluster assembly protein SufD